MANPEHLALLKQGVKVWNEWRQANQGIRPELGGADLSKADLREADLYGADLGGANLGGADLSGANLGEAILSKADLHKTDLGEAILREAHLYKADLGGADLSRADLGEAILSKADLHKTDLREAHLYKAHLRGADLSGADLRGADLGGAHLRGADLSGADLRGADLGGANLYKANLWGAILGGADLSGAILLETALSNVNLTEVKGLDTCRHDGPSTLDFRTLQQSGPLPPTFLRGCGLPDLLIDYLPSLLSQPIQFYSCFISYSSKDEDFAQRLHADLQNKGVRCWFAPDDMKSGREIYEQIGEAIRLYEKLLLVLSEHSMSSKWVETEIIKAQQRAVREKRQVLFPIRLVAFKAIQHWERFDADTGIDLAKEVRKYFIPDFSNWKSHDAYQQAFDRLLRDLKPELERRPETS